MYHKVTGGALLIPFLESTIMFSVIYDNYEKNLKQELWMCHKNMDLTMDEIYEMTIRDRKFYIQTHNKAVEREVEQMKASTRKK